MPVDRRPPPSSISDRLSAYLLRQRFFGQGVAEFRDTVRTRVVPNHWTSIFGAVTMACLVTVTATGLLLMFFYTPSSAGTIYTGPYSPLHGAPVSQAFASTMRISFEVPGGLLIRQAHHWAGLLLPAALLLQILATFFTGAFRSPRKGMWLLLFLIYVASLAGGWSGYALPDDMLSGSGLRITEGILLGIPVVGTWLATLFFGGPFPGTVIANLYVLHVAVVPALLIVLVGARLLAAWHHKPPQFPGLGRTDDNVVGLPLVPTAAARASGLGLITAGLVLLISALVTVNPIWLYGPGSPGDASAGSQPDWYTGFLDGALRLVPPGWEVVWLDRTWTLALLVPLAVVTLFLTALALYPFLEQWISGDGRTHHLLDRPRSAPTRTGIGVAGIVFYGVLWVGGSADLIATHLNLGLEQVITLLQVLLIVGPAIGFVLARRVCFALQRKDREILLHGFETGRIVRLPGGEYVEVHHAVDEFERWRIGPVDGLRPLRITPDERGRVTLAQRVRVALSRFFFEDRIADLGAIDAGEPDGGQAVPVTADPVARS